MLWKVNLLCLVRKHCLTFEKRKKVSNTSVNKLCSSRVQLIRRTLLFITPLYINKTQCMCRPSPGTVWFNKLCMLRNSLFLNLCVKPSLIIWEADLCIWPANICNPKIPFADYVNKITYVVCTHTKNLYCFQFQNVILFNFSSHVIHKPLFFVAFMFNVDLCNLVWSPM